MKASTGCSRGRHDKPTQLQREVNDALRQQRIVPKKRLGQNFTIDDSFLKAMTQYADLDSNDIVLEVGAGLGFLTRLLAVIAKKVIAVEVDSRLVAILRRQFSDAHNVELVEHDVLTADVPRFDKVVSTPPYSISSPLLFWLLDKPFKVAVMTFQEEFAKRLTAQVGSKDYSRLTVATYHRADVELLDHVSRENFYPPPDVDSTIVRLKPKPAPFRVKDETTFSAVLQAIFTQPNRKLRNAIMPFLLKHGMTKDRAKAFADSLTFHDKRVRELAPEDFGAIANEITEKNRLL